MAAAMVFLGFTLVMPFLPFYLQTLGIRDRREVALWSGLPATDGAVRRAWGEVRNVRRGLSDRPFSARLRAALELRSLLPPPGQTRGRR